MGCELVNLLYRITRRVARLDRLAALMTRLGLVGVTLWIGGMKLLTTTTPAGYEHHGTAEGALGAPNVNWHHANGAYQMSLMLGVTIVAIGVLIAVGFYRPAAGVIGGLLLTGMSLAILSFLIATADVWVAAPGAATRGVAFLVAFGRFAVKGAILLGVSLGCAADSAKQFVVKRGGPFGDEALISYWGR
jgi:reactive chlorine resistance protein C